MFNVTIPVLIAKRSRFVPSQIIITMPAHLPPRSCGPFLRTELFRRWLADLAQYAVDTAAANTAAANRGPALEHRVESPYLQASHYLPIVFGTSLLRQSGVGGIPFLGGFSP
jgi:hypothetical protein